MGLNMDMLIRNFQAAKELGAKFVGVAFRLPGNPEVEVIINPSENFDAKLAYYKEAYGPNLAAVRNAEVRIVGFTYGNDFAVIQRDLLGAN